MSKKNDRNNSLTPVDDFLHRTQQAPSGICPECFNLENVDDEGRIIRHSATVDGNFIDFFDFSDIPWCDGGGQKPEGEVKPYIEWSSDERPKHKILSADRQTGKQYVRWGDA